MGLWDGSRLGATADLKGPSLGPSKSSGFDDEESADRVRAELCCSVFMERGHAPSRQGASLLALASSTTSGEGHRLACRPSCGLVAAEKRTALGLWRTRTGGFSSTRVRAALYVAQVKEPVLESFVGGMTVREFCARTNQSVEKLVEFCSSQRAPVRKTLASPARSTANAVGVDTRSRAGREKFDLELIQILRGVRSGMAARDIAEETGATLVQIRSAVARLVAQSKVRFDGKTAARRYWACG